MENFCLSTVWLFWAMLGIPNTQRQNREHATAGKPNTRPDPDPTPTRQRFHHRDRDNRTATPTATVTRENRPQLDDLKSSDRTENWRPEPRPRREKMRGKFHQKNAKNETQKMRGKFTYEVMGPNKSLEK